MKIGIVLPNVPVYSETFFSNYLLALKNKGYEIIIFVSSNKKQPAFHDFKVVQAPNVSTKSLSTFGNIIGLAFKLLFKNFTEAVKLYKLDKQDGVSLIRRIKNSFINSHFFDYQLDWLHFGYGALAVHRENVARVIGAKMAVSFRGYDYYYFPQKHKDCYKILYSKQVKYHVLSMAMKQDLLSKGISSNNCVVIPPAINVDFFTNNTTISCKLPIAITTVSRLHTVKGIDYMLQAMKILKDLGINFHFKIIGSGNEFESLNKLRHDLNIEDYVTFMGTLNPNEVKSELEKTCIYLQYSHEEGFCNAVLEAQAMGLLCIVSNAEGLQENVVNECTGWIIERKSPKILVQKIIEVINMPQENKMMISKNASQRVQQQFNMAKQNQSFIKFYEL